MEIKDKVVIITGASQGIGLAAARHLAGLGAKVVLASRSADILKKLENELQGSFAIVTDMKKPADIKRLIQKTMNKFGRIDVLINNAGQGMYGNLEDMNLDDFRSIMSLNLFSVVLAMQEVIPIMRDQGGGMIINISSQVTRRYIPRMSAYSSTKYALNAISMISREELAKEKIIVSMVLPKLTETNFAKNSIGSRSADLPGGDPPELVAKRIEDAIRTEEAILLV